jgi:hypothetical protein
LLLLFYELGSLRSQAVFASGFDAPSWNDGILDTKCAFEKANAATIALMMGFGEMV